MHIYIYIYIYIYNIYMLFFIQVLLTRACRGAASSLRTAQYIAPLTLLIEYIPRKFGNGNLVSRPISVRANIRSKE